MTENAYDVPGHERRDVKVAFQVLVNANSRKVAVAAVADTLGGSTYRKAAFGRLGGSGSSARARGRQLLHGGGPAAPAG
jgi:hypothetical protein